MLKMPVQAHGLNWRLSVFLDLVKLGNYCKNKVNECLVIDTTGKESGHSEVLIIYLFTMQASCVSSDC